MEQGHIGSEAMDTWDREHMMGHIGHNDGLRSDGLQ